MIRHIFAETVKIMKEKDPGFGLLKNTDIEIPEAAFPTNWPGTKSKVTLYDLAVLCHKKKLFQYGKKEFEYKYNPRTYKEDSVTKFTPLRVPDKLESNSKDFIRQFILAEAFQEPRPGPRP